MRLDLEKNDLISNFYGDVLEIGAGSGVNLKYYNFSKIDKLVLTNLDLNSKLKANNKKVSIEKADVMDLQYEDQSFDIVFFSLVFCSVKDVDLGLQEVRRVLKDDGFVCFLEHIEPEKNPLKKIFNVLNKPWSKIAKGCNLNRDFKSSMIKNKFAIIEEKYFYKKIGFVGKAIKGE